MPLLFCARRIDLAIRKRDDALRFCIDANTVVWGERAAKRHTVNLIRHILKQKESDEVCVFFFAFRKPKVSLEELLGREVKVQKLSLPAKAVVAAWDYLHVPPLDWLLPGTEVYHATYSFVPPTRRIREVVTIRGIVPLALPRFFSASYTRTIQLQVERAKRYAAAIVAVSKKTKEEIMHHAGVEEERVFVIEHGVDPWFRPLEEKRDVWNRLRQRFRLDRPYLLYVGTVSHWKNIFGALEAYAYVRRKVDVDFVLAGPLGNAYEESLRLLSEKRISGVRFLGRIEELSDDLLYLYNGAELLFHPSFYEGFCAPPLEAMACGLPVVVSNCSSLPETVGDAALLVNPHSPEEMAEGILQVLEDRGLQQQLRAKGYEQAAKFRWEEVARKHLVLYRWLGGHELAR